MLNFMYYFIITFIAYMIYFSTNESVSKSGIILQKISAGTILIIFFYIPFYAISLFIDGEIFYGILSIFIYYYFGMCLAGYLADLIYYLIINSKKDSNDDVQGDVQKSICCVCCGEENDLTEYFCKYCGNKIQKLPKAKNIKFIESIEWEIIDNKVLAAKNPLKIRYFSADKRDFILYPFAPGSYIELENEVRDNTKWCYLAFEHTSAITEQYVLEYHLKSIKENSSKNAEYKILRDKSKYFSVNNMPYKIGFYLPLERKFDLGYKYYFVVVFGLDSKKDFPSMEDSYIIINVSFRVNLQNYVLFDDKQKECEYIKSIMDDSIFDKENKTDAYKTIYRLIKMNKMYEINNMDTISTFISLNYKHFAFVIANMYDIDYIRNAKQASLFAIYYRLYPALTGKIGYIYHKCDILDFKSLKNASSYCANDNRLDGKEYFHNILSFSNNIANLFIAIWDMILLWCDIKSPSIKELHLQIIINYISEILNIDKDSIPKAMVTKGKSVSHYDTINNIIAINADNKYLRVVLDMIIHEFRHFYIRYILKQDKDSICKNPFLLYIRDCLSLSSDEHLTMFKAFVQNYRYTLGDKTRRLLPSEQDAMSASIIFIDMLIRTQVVILEYNRLDDKNTLENIGFTKKSIIDDTESIENKKHDLHISNKIEALLLEYPKVSEMKYFEVSQKT